MARLEICDQFGFSIAGLTEEKIRDAGLNDAQMAALSILISASEAHTLAVARKAAAEKNVGELMDIEAKCQAAVLASSVPVTFQMAHAANAAAYAAAHRKG